MSVVEWGMVARRSTLLAALTLTLAAGCNGETASPGDAEVQAESDDAPASMEGADVLEVTSSGEGPALQLSVTIRSPDTGCDQYADWWEVAAVDDAGAATLVYRRILAHSHVDEQPFTRSGGPVDVEPEQELVIRAHMNTSGYGGQALRGTIAGGFEVAPLDAGWAQALAEQAPLPDGCAF